MAFCRFRGMGTTSNSKDRFQQYKFLVGTPDMSKLPYAFLAIPHEFLTEDFLRDPVMMRFRDIVKSCVSGMNISSDFSVKLRVPLLLRRL